ncbi:MAG: HU family DNA-binding protein [Thermoplasmata archaeon]
MTKAELIDAIAKKAGLTKKKSAQAVDAIVESIIEALKKGDKVTLVGFGTFSVTKRKPRKGRNPKTGEEVKIPATKSPKFTPGKAFKEAIK